MRVPYIGIGIVHGPSKFNLQATIDHNGLSMFSGDYTTTVNCRKNILLQQKTIIECEMADAKTLQQHI